MRFYVLLSLLFLAGNANAQQLEFNPTRIRQYLGCTQTTSSEHAPQGSVITDQEQKTAEYHSMMRCDAVVTMGESITADAQKLFKMMNPEDDEFTREESVRLFALYDVNSNVFVFSDCDLNEDNILTLEEYKLCAVISYATFIVAADKDVDYSLSKKELTSMIRRFATIFYKTMTAEKQDAKIDGLGVKTEYTLPDVVKVDVSLFEDFTADQTRKQQQRLQKE